jgi:poly(A) polymerase
MAPAIAHVSAERVRDELTKLLRHGRGRGLRLLRDTGLLAVLLPEVDAMRGVPQPPRFHPEGDVFVHTALVLDQLRVPPGGDANDETVLLWAGLLHDVGKPPTLTRDDDGRIRFNLHDKLGVEMSAAVMERLRFPTRAIERVGSLVLEHIRIASTPKMRPHRLRRFLAQDDIELHLALHHADTAASHGDFDVLDFCRAQLTAYANEPIVPPPLLRGRDLLALGYRPGPRMGRILRWVQDAQLDGRVSDAEEAARLVRERFPQAGGRESHDGRS